MLDIDEVIQMATILEFQDVTVFKRKGHDSDMTQRRNGKESREEYLRVQARKKRQLEKRQMYREGFADPSTKRSLIKKQAAERRLPRGERYLGRQERRRQRGSVSRGMFLLALQIIAMVVFMISLFSLDILTIGYLAAAGCMLILTAGITLVTQLSTKRKRMGGKVFSCFISCILVFGTYYIIKTDSVLASVTGGKDYKVDHMVVAVLKDNPAETIKDAKGYTFGVQYAKDTDHMEMAVKDINKEMKKDISTTEVPSIPTQAAALTGGKVDAIIYNKQYTEIMKQSVDGFEDKIKIIHEYSIKSEAKDLTIDVAVQDEPFSVYFSGNDNYDGMATNPRSDVNLVGVVNPKTHQILLITTPRDYYVEIPGVSQGQPDKLTHAGIYGVDISVDTLEALYDVEIPFYARVNFSSMIDIVDILGGVDVDSDIAFTTGVESEEIVDIKEGVNHLNGKQALAFSRERKAFLAGDNQRGKNQQKVMTAMLRKMLSPTMIVKASSILDTVAKNVDTNMSMDQVRALIKQQIRQGSSWRIASLSAEGTGAMKVCFSGGSRELSVIMPDEASVQTIKDTIDRVMAGETIEDSVVIDAK